MSKRVYKRKTVKMLHCPNCGAQYEAGLLRCPYCKSVDDYQDETEYLEDMDELKDKLEDLPEDVLREHKKKETVQAAQDLKRILTVVGAIAAALLMFIGVMTFFDKVVEGNSDRKIKERAQEEYLWKQENFPKLDELYKNKDYEGLLEFADSQDNAGLYDWEHYALLDGLRILKYIPSDIAIVEEMEQNNETGTDHYLDTLAYLLRDELELLYFDHREVSAEDVGTIREMSGEYLKDLETRFALTDEELAAFERKAAHDMGFFYIQECKEFLKKR